MGALEEAIAKIEELGRAALVQHEAAKRDPRLKLIAEMVEELAPAPLSDGFAGGQQVFATLGSSRHWRHMRAKLLYVARDNQLRGYPGATRFWLKKAAEQRKSEMYWKARERSVTHALLMSAAEPAPERFERSEAMQAAE